MCADELPMHARAVGKQKTSLNLLRVHGPGVCRVMAGSNLWIRTRPGPAITAKKCGSYTRTRTRPDPSLAPTLSNPFLNVHFNQLDATQNVRNKTLQHNELPSNTEDKEEVDVRIIEVQGGRS